MFISCSVLVNSYVLIWLKFVVCGWKAYTGYLLFLLEVAALLTAFIRLNRKSSYVHGGSFICRLTATSITLGIPLTTGGACVSDFSHFIYLCSHH